MVRQPGLFDLDERYAALSAAGDPLERLLAVVDFELLRSELEAALERSDRTRGGRPPYDPVLMFKILVVQTLYTLSDDQTEYQIQDRLSFMRFCGLALEDRVPDAKTIWLFREQLTKAGAIERLFARFDAVLRDAGYLAMGGQIVDATVVQARRPRLTTDEKATIKRGGVPASWSKAKRAQMDIEGRWTLKRGRKRRPAGPAPRNTQSEIVVPIFGYKNHLGIDRRHGFIRTYQVTHAAAHDGRQLGKLLDRQNTASPVWADSRVPLGGEHQAAGAPWAGAPVPAAQAARQTDAAAHGPRQRQPGAGPGRGRTRLRQPEMPARPGHPLGWPGPRRHQARPRQSGDQHAPPDRRHPAAAPHRHPTDPHPRRSLRRRLPHHVSPQNRFFEAPGCVPPVNGCRSDDEPRFRPQYLPLLIRPAAGSSEGK